MTLQTQPNSLGGPSGTSMQKSKLSSFYLTLTRKHLSIPRDLVLNNSSRNFPNRY